MLEILMITKALPCVYVYKFAMHKFNNDISFIVPALQAEKLR